MERTTPEASAHTIPASRHNVVPRIPASLEASNFPQQVSTQPTVTLTSTR
jgi:hypothetical protein